MSADQFEKLGAYDLVMPLDHSSRMLGFIAWMLSSYFGVEKENSKAIRKMCMPWISESEFSASEAIAQLSNVAEMKTKGL